MRDLRMKIAGIALALGLGGLGGYAISSKNDQPATSGTLAGTKVVRRTVHAKRPKHKAELAHARARAAHSLTSAPVSTGSSGSSSSSSSGSPVSTGSSGSSGGSSRPVHTGSSGASGGSGGSVSTGSSGGGAGGGESEGGGGEREGGD